MNLNERCCSIPQMKIVLMVGLISTVLNGADQATPICRELRSFKVPEAHQGVAVDEDHFYAVTNRGIGKYDKNNGKLITRWKAAADSPLRHLNSGVVVDHKLYCAHSNWPAKPTVNSVEIWDASSLKHLSSREFKKSPGAMTWIDRFDGHWWIAFAFYGEDDNIARTTVVQFDDRWEQKKSWKFPQKVIERFRPFSNSGGSLGPDGLLYVTGHDRKEMYALRVPHDDPTLQLVNIVPLGIEGQGIAWSRSDVGIVVGIRRKTKEVVISRLSHTQEYGELKRTVRWQRDPRNPVLPPGKPGSFDATRCMNPWVLRQKSEYQLYYSGGDAAGKQRIAVARANIGNLSKWHRSAALFETGAAGAFDAKWCVLPHVVHFASNQWHLYYTGNAGRGTGLSAFPGIGMATSRDGTTWTKHPKSPVIAPSGRAGDPDALGIAGGSVIPVKRPNGKTEWWFYYTGCPTIGSPLLLNQQKTICLAVSNDGVEWKKRGALMYRDPNRDYENIGVAGPVVLRDDKGGFRMWYSAIGTRWGYYSICYAESDDGIHWRRGPRSEDNLQLTPQGAGWEKQMVEYPTIIQEGNRLRLFYCGNGYGRTGIGTALSIEPD